MESIKQKYVLAETFFLVDDTIKLVKEKDERKALANRWKTEPQC